MALVSAVAPSACRPPATAGRDAAPAVATAGRDVAPVADTRGGVATEHPRATEIGLAILEQGGNAVDAAIAISYAGCVLNASSCGIGGGGFMLIRTAEGAVHALDYRERAPEGAHRDLYRRGDEILRAQSRTGGLAVGVPGEIAGLEAARERFARLPRATLMEPAIALARDGFPIGQHLAKAIARNKGSIRASTGLAPLLLDASGTPRAAGSILKRPALARTLELVARDGSAAFYHGAVANELARSVTAAGGILTADDLAAYRPEWRTPLRATYRGFEIFTMPPPSSGGVLLEVLHILAADDLAAMGHLSPEYLHLLAEAMKHGFADRARWYGDPAFTNVPIERLTSPTYGQALRKRIKPDTVGPAGQYGMIDAGTAHYSVMDEDGMIVGCTTTINTAFGAMIIGGDTGIILNNEMDDFSIAPGVPNSFGLVGGEANAVDSGKRPLSSMTPVIALGPDDQRIVVGGSGGPLIISGVLQTLLGMIDFGLGAEPAIHAPRIHDQWAPPVLGIEEGIDATIAEALRDRGHTVRTLPFSAAVQVVARRNAHFQAAADARKGGRGATW